MSTVPVTNSFASDNTTPICPEVLSAIIDANTGIEASYGEDNYSQRLDDIFSTLFDTEVRAFPVLSGTAANALSLAALTPSFGKVFCHAMSHINTDECAAPEFFTGGGKLIPIDGVIGKLSVEDLGGAIRGAGVVHSAQPATVSFAQTCETGTVYELDEIRAISELAHSQGLKVHMDGARCANALVSLNTSPAEMTWRSGVDVLSFGATKNGCLAAEAVIFFNPDQVGAFPYQHKRSGQLISKMRFISAQLEAYVNDDVWLRNARHANQMADKLSRGLLEIPGIELAFPAQANELFVHLPDSVIEQLNGMGYSISQQELDSSAPPRFVTAWNTSDDDVDSLIAAVAKFA